GSPTLSRAAPVEPAPVHSRSSPVEHITVDPFLEQMEFTGRALFTKAPVQVDRNNALPALPQLIAEPIAFGEGPAFNRPVRFGGDLLCRGRRHGAVLTILPNSIPPWPLAPLQVPAYCP